MDYKLNYKTMKEHSNDLSASLVTGKSTIDHGRRVALNMGLLHYILMDYCLGLEKKGLPIRMVNLWTQLGIKSRQFQKAAAWLLDNGYLSVCQENEKPESTGKHREITLKGKKKLEVMLEEFWNGDTVNGRAIKWSGVVGPCKNLLKDAIDEYGFDYIMEQKKWYFRLLGENKDRPVLMGATFLSRQSKRYTEDFKGQCKKLYEPVLPEIPVREYTPEEIRDLFEEE